MGVIGQPNSPWLVEYMITNTGGSEAEITHLVPRVVLFVIKSFRPYRLTKKQIE